MADEYKAGTPKAEIEEESNARIDDARAWKARRLLDFREAYFFAAPSRQRQLSSQSGPPQAPPGDEPELNTDFAFILVADFVTEIVNTYLQEAQQWCERKAGEGFAEVFDQVADKVRADDRKIFDAIKASNFYAELPKAFNPDLAIGTAGIYIDRSKPHMPITVLAVPLREIEINLGPNGEIDDRFIVRHARNVHVKKLVGQEAWDGIDNDIRKEIEARPQGRTEIAWGWWRLWERDDDECWQHVLMVKRKVVRQAEIKGDGCCPFLVMRFNPSADWPWAEGPLLQGLPSLRQVDEFERMRPEAVERAINPAIKYPDDSVTNIDQGIEPGMGYPTRPGSGPDFGPIYQQPPIDPVLMELETKEHRLRKLFYVDHPEQTGDTPPTLGQWLDELARMQRRIGTAGMSFWREGPRAIFLRFKYLMEQAGSIASLKDKEGKLISTQPYNPTQRAAEQQEIATAFQCAQALAQMFPEEWRVWIDGKGSMQAIIEKMRTAGLLKMRKESDVKQALGNIQGLLGNAGLREKAGAPVPAGAGAPPAAA